MIQLPPPPAPVPLSNYLIYILIINKSGNAGEDVSNYSSQFFCKFVVNENFSVFILKISARRDSDLRDFVYFSGESRKNLGGNWIFEKNTILINWKLSISQFPLPSTPTPIFSGQDSRFIHFAEPEWGRALWSLIRRSHFSYIEDKNVHYIICVFVS